jgi:hypothetical protein
MSKTQEARLGNFLREVSNWKWDDYVKAEHDDGFTSNQAVIFALIRACAMQNLQAIKATTNRLDGKLATPLKIEYPKVFYLYPNAKLPEVNREENGLLPLGELLEKRELIVSEPETEEDLATLSIRQTVAKMASYPRKLPQDIIERQERVEQSVRGQGPRLPESKVPRVKSVVAAHLLAMAANRSIDALGEVFDQIDGKLAETFQVLGEDLFITDYGLIAPDDAYINDSGILEKEASVVQDMWANKLGRDLENGTR